jgi:hypothetical protein
MGFAIDDFKSQVGQGGGIAMGNLYKIFLPPIRGDARALNLLCKATSLPGRQILSNEKTMGLHTTKMAYGYAVEDVTLTFHCLNDMEVRQYFETWQNLAVNQETQEIGYFNEYTHPVIIQHIKKSASFPIKKKKLFDSGKIPSSIRGRLPRLGPIDLAQGELDLNLVFGDDITYTLVLDKAYPTSLSAIELSDDGQLLEVTVQLSYKNWKSKDGDNKGSDFIQGLAGELIRKFL